MTSKFESLKKELAALNARGELLYFSMLDELGKLPKSVKEKVLKPDAKLPRFDSGYESWYSEALQVIKQILPDRYEDFVRQYKVDKRKEIDVTTYGISDYLLGIKTSRGGSVVADQSAALPKFQQQQAILKAAEKRFESSLFDIQEVLQADLFDSELEAALGLSKSGFHRGGGAVAGVVMEKHLGRVFSSHNLKSKKAHPTIADFNDGLKEAGIIDVPKWRFIQHLGDLRNLCDHSKDREPTKEDVSELVEGVHKVIKTVF